MMGGKKRAASFPACAPASTAAQPHPCTDVARHPTNIIRLLATPPLKILPPPPLLVLAREQQTMATSQSRAPLTGWRLKSSDRRAMGGKPTSGASPAQCWRWQRGGRPGVSSTPARCLPASLGGWVDGAGGSGPIASWGQRLLELASRLPLLPRLCCHCYLPAGSASAPSFQLILLVHPSLHACQPTHAFPHSCTRCPPLAFSACACPLLCLCRLPPCSTLPPARALRRSRSTCLPSAKTSCICASTETGKRGRRHPPCCATPSLLTCRCGPTCRGGPRPMPLRWLR
jgi:hypothetical protein